MKSKMGAWVGLVAALVPGVVNAECEAGLPDTNRVLLDLYGTEIAAFNDGWMAEQFRFNDTWTSGRGYPRVDFGELEYSKVVLASFVLSLGIDNRGPAILGTPGNYQEGLNLGSAFHRSGDEWALSITDQDYPVCNQFSSSLGVYLCPNRSGLFAQETRKFGSDSEQAITDTTDLFGNERSDFHSWYNMGNDQHVYHCGAFEDTDGRADDAALPRLALIQATMHYVNIQWDRRGKEEVPATAERFVWNTGGRGRNAIAAETVDARVGGRQVGQQALCDVVQSSQEWVPLIVQEVFNEVTIRELGKRRFPENIEDGISPYSCDRSPGWFEAVEAGLCPTGPTCSAENEATLCDDHDGRTVDGCGTDGCCINVQIPR